METSTKFSNTEVVFVITNSVISKLFLVYPSAFAALGASASIILALLTSALGLVFTFLTIRLYKTKTDITNLIHSKFLKFAFSILVTALFTVNQGYFVRSVAESLKISILPDSPIFFITFIYMAGVVVCSHTGLKSIIRAHSFVTPFTLILILLITASSVSNFDFFNLFPVLGNGSKMFIYLVVLASYFADFLLLMFIMPFTSQNSTCKKIIVPSYIISSVALLLVIATYTLVIPYSTSDTFFIPIYRIAQYIDYKSFMARMESIFTIGWMLSYFLTSATFLYITSMISGRIFGAKSYRPFMYVIAFIIFAISFIPQDTNQLVEWSNFFSYPKLVVGMLLPLIILYSANKREVSKS